MHNDEFLNIFEFLLFLNYFTTRNSSLSLGFVLNSRLPLLKIYKQFYGTGNMPISKHNIIIKIW